MICLLPFECELLQNRSTQVPITYTVTELLTALQGNLDLLAVVMISHQILQCIYQWGANSITRLGWGEKKTTKFHIHFV